MMYNAPANNICQYWANMNHKTNENKGKVDYNPRMCREALLIANCLTLSSCSIQRGP